MLTEDQKMNLFLQIKDVETEIMAGDPERVLKEVWVIYDYLRAVQQENK